MYLSLSHLLHFWVDFPTHEVQDGIIARFLVFVISPSSFAFQRAAAFPLFQGLPTALGVIPVDSSLAEKSLIDRPTTRRVEPRSQPCVFALRAQGTKALGVCMTTFDSAVSWSHSEQGVSVRGGC